MSTNDLKFQVDRNISVTFKLNWNSFFRMMDPIVLYYGKGQLSGFLVDPNGVLDVVSRSFPVSQDILFAFIFIQIHIF